MPYSIRKNPDGTYKVQVKDTKQVLAYKTKIPYKVIYAVEATKARRNGRKFPAKIAARKVRSAALARKLKKATKARRTIRKITKKRKVRKTRKSVPSRKRKLRK
jgi:hypothetical protein